VASANPLVEAPDLTSCDREPIRVPGSIQPHGVLLVVDPETLDVLQASANTATHFGRETGDVVERDLREVLGADAADAVAAAIPSELAQHPLYLATVRLGLGERQPFHVIGHRVGDAVVLEFEPTTHLRAVSFHALYALVRTFIERLEDAAGIEALTALAADEVRRLTGFDRVLVYRFDPEWHGQVLAESRNERLPSYLRHWFPASDIPAQARELYALNRLRLIADAAYQPVPLVPPLDPRTGAPLDMSHAALRSVSPAHLEYLRNMGVAASMSISVLQENRLWGLIACHHAEPRPVPFEVRAACEFLGQVLSLQLRAKERHADDTHRMHLRTVQTRLLAHMAEEASFVDGLTRHPRELLAFADAAGAAVVFEDRCTLLGATPDEAAVRSLVDWLIEHGREDVFHTDALPRLLPNPGPYRAHATGLLAIAISKLYRSYVLWFRPEVVRTVTWGGDPRKPVEPAAGGAARLHPRRSFAAWQEIVRGRAIPWRPSELETAAELRNAIIGIVLRQAEERGQLTAELQRANQELEAFSYSVSHDLRAPFRHIVGYAELLRERLEHHPDADVRRYVNTVIESGYYAGTLVDNLLNFSRIGRAQLDQRAVPVDVLVSELQAELSYDLGGRRVTWDVGPLPSVWADPVMLRLVFQNLLSNALKYTRTREESLIRVRAETGPREVRFAISDNGVGFEMRYVDKLFGVFQRLHRMEDFEGTGIGLANVRRIIARHGGRTWAEGEVDRGATFYFTLPQRQVEPETT
jgi:light-regulated signal transduction histidine kinase (bacteriophytochrome)